MSEETLFNEVVDLKNGIESGSEQDDCLLLANIITNTVTKDTNIEILSATQAIQNLVHHNNDLDLTVGSYVVQLVRNLDRLLNSVIHRRLLKLFREILNLERLYTKSSGKTVPYYALGFVGLKWEHKNKQLRQLAGKYIDNEETSTTKAVQRMLLTHLRALPATGTTVGRTPDSSAPADLSAVSTDSEGSMDLCADVYDAPTSPEGDILRTESSLGQNVHSEMDEFSPEHRIDAVVAPSHSNYDTDSIPKPSTSPTVTNRFLSFPSLALSSPSFCPSSLQLPPSLGPPSLQLSPLLGLSFCQPPKKPDLIHRSDSCQSPSFF